MKNKFKGTDFNRFLHENGCEDYKRFYQQKDPYKFHYINEITQYWEHKKSIVE